jgi:uncharacterized protein (DUF488 family)
VIYTIGYEGLTTGEFTDILQAHAIDVLIDVRELPLSRKKGFSKNLLSKLVTVLDIQYTHMRELGAPREIRHNLRETGDWLTYCKAYISVLQEQGQALEKIASLAKSLRVCLMCFEEDYKVCHRSLITEKMLSVDLVKRVNHLNTKKEKAALVGPNV